jgi:Collagen triple helix repeat (20 copies)/Bacterial Ig-like domain
MRIRLSAQFIRYAIVGILGISIGGTSAIVGSGLIPGSDGVIQGCYQHTTGNLRVVADPSECHDAEIAISWNQVGRQGPIGPSGATGPTGAIGATGATGATGAIGATGANGIDGRNGLPGATGPAGPPGSGVTSLNSLNGLACGSDASGVTRVVYSAGTVAIFCDPSAPPEAGPPVYTGVTVGGNLATVTFNKPVCRAQFFNATTWQVTSNGINDLAFGDTIPICNALADNGVASASLILQNPPTPGSLVAVTLTASGHLELRDAAGNVASGPQTRTTTAGAPETIPPALVSAAGDVGSTTLKFTFSEPVFCTGFLPFHYVLSDNNSATTDPIVVGMGFSDPCGTSQLTAHRTFAVQLNAPLPGSTMFTVVLTPQPGEIRDMSGNSVPNPSTTTFTTPAPDLTPPTLTGARVVSNIGGTNLGDLGDAFTVTFSENMNGNTYGSIAITDPDGSTATIECSVNTSCTWDTAVITLTVTFTQLVTGTGGTTPAIQLPATIAGLLGITDLAGNAPDLPGSVDRVIDGV